MERIGTCKEIRCRGGSINHLARTVVWFSLRLQEKWDAGIIAWARFSESDGGKITLVSHVRKSARAVASSMWPYWRDVKVKGSESCSSEDYWNPRCRRTRYLCLSNLWSYHRGTGSRDIVPPSLGRRQGPKVKESTDHPSPHGKVPVCKVVLYNRIASSVVL